jgi:hypothetical protein
VITNKRVRGRLYSFFIFEVELVGDGDFFTLKFTGVRLLEIIDARIKGILKYT